MEKNILKELEICMEERHIKIPALAEKLGIPKDRMYKWYQQGTKPKEKDAIKIWNWINGENDDEVNNSVKEPETPYGNLAACLRIIESQQQLLMSQQQTIHFLTTGRSGTPKKAS